MLVVIASEKSRQRWSYGTAGLSSYAQRRTSGASGSGADLVAPFTIDDLKRAKNENGKND